MAGAAFFSSRPRAAQGAEPGRQAGVERGVRRVHRWIAVIFTLTVAANFIAMIWGPPPAWITYSPLPPLLFLLLTGLYMLVRHLVRTRQASRSLSTSR
jgi:peptidoglycan/LPS O-acetylase OafA/YrhL